MAIMAAADCGIPLSYTFRVSQVIRLNDDDDADCKKEEKLPSGKRRDEVDNSGDDEDDNEPPAKKPRPKPAAEAASAAVVEEPADVGAPSPHILEEGVKQGVSATRPSGKESDRLCVPSVEVVP